MKYMFISLLLLLALPTNSASASIKAEQAQVASIIESLFDIKLDTDPESDLSSETDTDSESSTDSDSDSDSDSNSDQKCSPYYCAKYPLPPEGTVFHSYKYPSVPQPDIKKKAD